MNYAEVLAVAVTLFFVMDPLGNIPVFNAVLARFDSRAVRPSSRASSCSRS